MTLILTAGEMMELGVWDEFMLAVGIDPLTEREDDEFELTEEEMKKLGLKVVRDD